MVVECLMALYIQMDITKYGADIDEDVKLKSTLYDYSDEELKEFGETIDRIVKAKKAGLDDKTLELLASNLPDIKVK